MPLERPASRPPGLAEAWRDFGATYAANGFIAFLFAASGPVAIILAVGQGGGLSEAQLASWLFGAFFVNGLLSILFCWVYRLPLVFFWTIPGTVLVGQALDHLPFAQVLGAYYVTGVLMLVLGLTGWVRRAMQALPMPIVMGMVAGVFLRFGLDWLHAFESVFAIAAAMTAAFFVCSAVPRLARRLPPLIGALAVGVAAVAATGTFAPSGEVTLALASPLLQAPAFSLAALTELVVPLAITVLVVQNGQGYAVLAAAGHRQPPITAVTVGCGLWSLLTAPVGAISTCLTGPANAIVASSGAKERHYTGGIFVGVLAILFGLLAPLFTRLMLAAPGAFIATLAGLAMLNVLRVAFVTAFRERFTLGALIAFLYTVADIAIFNIGAPFWGLVFGFATAWLLEREDFAVQRAAAR
ncbi:MAG TPA: benzoate/H(+) symporter BenE family transporter [Gammaproteobacteria bacterium]